MFTRVRQRYREKLTMFTFGFIAIAETKPSARKRSSQEQGGDMNRSILNSITAIAIDSAPSYTSIAHAKEVKVTDAAFKFNKAEHGEGAENVRIGSYERRRPAVAISPSTQTSTPNTER